LCFNCDGSERARMKLATTSEDAPRLQLRLVMRILVIAFFLAMVVGIIMAWVFYFRSFDKTFASLAAEELLLSQEIYNETTARLLADMALMQTQAAQQSALDLDIAMRIAEQTYVNITLIADIAAREAGDAAIEARLLAEMAFRMGNNTALQIEIDNATTVMEAVNAFNAYSMQQFMIKMGNITDITAEIEAETVARIAADAALFAADIIIDADLVLLVSELTAEVNARIAKDAIINNQLHLITTSLLRTIDGQLPIAANMVFQSLSASLVIGSGIPANQITVTQNALLSLAGVLADASGNIAITANNGLSVTFPGPHIVQLLYTGPVPPPAMNSARLIAVYPHGLMNCWVQSHDCLNDNGGGLKNGWISDCVGMNSVCHSQLGTQWMCSGGFSTQPGGRCVNDACADESQCNNLLGNPWHCRKGMCVEDYCMVDDDCNDAYGTTTGTWFCVNYACARAVPNSPNLPIFVDVYPGGGTYQGISQPNTSPFCGSNCVWPEEGAINGQLGAYPHVYGNRRPYDPHSPYNILNLECIFDVAWDGKYCGFIMPAAGGTFIVQMTINIRVGINQGGVFYGNLWFYMHIDRSGAPTPNWEMVDSDFVGINNLGVNPIGETYITMTTTIIASTAVPGSSMTPTMLPGTYVYTGWSAYWPHSADSGSSQYASWYSITYDITQIA
jgi:hypothetical protein